MPPLVNWELDDDDVPMSEVEKFIDSVKDDPLSDRAEKDEHRNLSKCASYRPAKKNRKPSILRGLDTGIIIESQQSMPQGQKSQRRSTRLHEDEHDKSRYDMSFHPMDLVTRRRQASKKGYVEPQFERDLETEEDDDDGGGGEAEESDSRILLANSESEAEDPLTKKMRRETTPTRKSTRLSSSQRPNYATTKHPQDRLLAKAGVIRRQRHRSGAKSEYRKRADARNPAKPIPFKGSRSKPNVPPRSSSRATSLGEAMRSLSPIELSSDPENPYDQTEEAVLTCNTEPEGQNGREDSPGMLDLNNFGLHRRPDMEPMNVHGEPLTLPVRDAAHPQSERPKLPTHVSMSELMLNGQVQTRTSQTSLRGVAVEISATEGTPNFHQRNSQQSREYSSSFSHPTPCPKLQQRHGPCSSPNRQYRSANEGATLPSSSASTDPSVGQPSASYQKWKKIHAPNRDFQIMEDKIPSPKLTYRQEVHSALNNALSYNKENFYRPEDANEQQNSPANFVVNLNSGFTAINSFASHETLVGASVHQVNQADMATNRESIRTSSEPSRLIREAQADNSSPGMDYPSSHEEPAGSTTNDVPGVLINAPAIPVCDQSGSQALENSAAPRYSQPSLDGTSRQCPSYITQNLESWRHGVAQYPVVCNNFEPPVSSQFHGQETAYSDVRRHSANCPQPNALDPRPGATLLRKPSNDNTPASASNHDENSAVRKTSSQKGLSLSYTSGLRDVLQRPLTQASRITVPSSTQAALEQTVGSQLDPHISLDEPRAQVRSQNQFLTATQELNREISQTLQRSSTEGKDSPGDTVFIAEYTIQTPLESTSRDSSGIELEDSGTTCIFDFDNDKIVPVGSTAISHHVDQEPVDPFKPTLKQLKLIRFAERRARELQEQRQEELEDMFSGGGNIMSQLSQSQH